MNMNIEEWVGISVIIWYMIMRIEKEKWILIIIIMILNICMEIDNKGLTIISIIIIYIIVSGIILIYVITIMINNRPIELNMSNNLIVYNIGYNIMVWIISNDPNIQLGVDIEPAEKLTVDIIDKMWVELYIINIEWIGIIGVLIIISMLILQIIVEK